MMPRMNFTQRRRLLRSGLALPLSTLPLWPLAQAQAADDAIGGVLRTGGVVVALRHALAPGTYDPPEFKLGECSTQRNLNDEGRKQAQRLGQWFQRQGLKPTLVRSSPWCRCMDTASGAFGAAQAWSALGSPRGRNEQSNDESLGQMRQALAAVPAGRFEVWVTHAFVQQALVGQSTGSGEGLVLRGGPGGAVQLVARLAVA
jgi:Histidine phosphatase superfamily (branch 1)